MKYKAIMLDLDDTTVIHGRDSLPSTAVTHAIKEAKNKIHVGIATARTLKESRIVIEHLELSGPCVVTGGTQIYDPQKDKVIHEVSIPADIPKKLHALSEKHGLLAFYYDGSQDAPFKKGSDPEKVLSVYIPELDFKYIDALVKEFSIDPRIRVQKLTAWDKRFMALDITASDASKQHGVLETARILGISTDEIIGVGDGYNDFPLLMACGLKVAMGNAVAELKAIADFIAPSVEDDGVATVIEKFVLAV